MAQLCRKCATQVTCIKGYNSFNVFPAKDMYRAASVKNNEKFSRFIIKLSQYVIHSAQNNAAINIATAVKWMAINEECLLWGI